jgi:Excreted virulence factor EspC, type VII ESX diderm
MTRPDITLSTEEVRRHARMVDDAAAMCSEAAAGAEYLDLHDEVYGMLCSPPMVPKLFSLQELAFDEIRDGADATAHLADLLRTLADNVDITDGEAACRIRGVGG